jgi:hypothetical protein
MEQLDSNLVQMSKEAYISWKVIIHHTLLI